MSSSFHHQSTPSTDQFQLLLSIPPQSFSGLPNNPHAVAHAALETLRESGDTQCLFLKVILEQQQQKQHPDPITTWQLSEELLFHCIVGTRHVILTQWNQYSDHFTSTIRDYFMCLGNDEKSDTTLGGRPSRSSSRTIRLACFTLSVAFWKRQWSELLQRENQQQQEPASSSAFLFSSGNRAAAYPEQERQILEQIGNIPRFSNPPQLFQYILNRMAIKNNVQDACNYISALVGEFSGKSVVPYQLPMEFHKEAYSTFETQGALDESLKLVMTALSQTVAEAMEEATTTSTDFSSSSPFVSPETIELTKTVVQVTNQVIEWEFGGAEWMHLPSSRVLIRPPEHWREYLMRPDFIGAIFALHQQVLQQQQSQQPPINGSPVKDLAHGLRQLLLLLCSFTGPMFRGKQEREHFAQYLCEGSHTLLSLCLVAEPYQQSLLLCDTYTLVARLIANFRLAVVCHLPTFLPVLEGIRVTATEVLRATVTECELARGDLSSMEHREWREESLTLVLEIATLLCLDPWLKDPRADETSRGTAYAMLIPTLGPLYEEFVTCRTQMAYLDAFYRHEHGEDHNTNHDGSYSNDDGCDDQEEMDAVANEEEMVAVACLGRLHLPRALSCMSSLFQRVVPKLQNIWQETGPMSSNVAAQLEEGRIMVVFMACLLTDRHTVEDEREEEESKIPASIESSCDCDKSLVADITSFMLAVLSLMEGQATKMTENPTNLRIGPELGQAFLGFLERWTCAYLFRAVNNATANQLRLFWSGDEAASQVVAFSFWLCSKYVTYWTHHGVVQEGVGKLLLAMGKHSPKMRAVMAQLPPFQELLVSYWLSLGMSKSTSLEQLEAKVRTHAEQAPQLSMDLVRGYHHLRIRHKSKLLTAFLIICGDQEEAPLRMFNELLRTVYDTFSSLTQALS
jgi:hypothetical protein